MSIFTTMTGDSNKKGNILDTQIPLSNLQNTQYQDIMDPGGKVIIFGNNSNLELGEISTKSNDTEYVQVSNHSLTYLQRAKEIFKRHKWVVHLFWGMFLTGWWLSIIIQKKHRHKWLIPTIIWILAISRLLTFHLPTRHLLTWIDWVWQITVIKVINYIPNGYRTFSAAIGTLVVILIGTFASPEYPGSKRSDRAMSFLGCMVTLFGLWATSVNRKAIKWHTVISGMLLQFIIAWFVLRTKTGYDIFQFISFLARKLLSFADFGTSFIFGLELAALPAFFFTVIPAIIFFIAFVNIFYYWGVIQWVIGKFACFFFWAMKVSGAEAVVAAASPFVGQGESAILIRPFIPHLTKAEFHQIMTSGFATIAGSVLVAYISMGVNPQALISSCVMSIPASIATSKLRYPETEESLSANKIVIPEEEGPTKEHNVLHAFSNGAAFGLKVSGLIFSNLLCIIALVSLFNSFLSWFASFWNIYDLTLETILGYVLFPVAFLLGAPRKDAFLIAQLLGTKIIQNEFIGYSLLQSPAYSSLTIRGRMLATYSLCGFANLGSVGTNIAVLGALSPARVGLIARLSFSALITGALSTLLSAAVAGMVLADMSQFVTSKSGTLA